MVGPVYRVIPGRKFWGLVLASRPTKCHILVSSSMTTTPTKLSIDGNDVEDRFMVKQILPFNLLFLLQKGVQVFLLRSLLHIWSQVSNLFLSFEFRAAEVLW